MGASAADIRSALSLHEPIAGPSNPQTKTTTTIPSTSRKPEGISRELYNLIGSSQPFLAAQLTKPKLKQKPNFASAVAGPSVTKWELRTFRNSARKDGLELQHWVKASEDPDSEYTFAKYNIENPHYVFSQEEYTRYLEDKPWTKELTDYLFELYHEYDGRWYIIWDRAEFPPECNFDIDDLKDRYYGVCHREKMRKRYLVNLESRTSEQLAEEEALYIEIRRLEQTERRFKRDREDLMRTLAGMDSGLPDIVEDDGGPLGVTPEVRSKKRKAGAGPSGLDTESLPATPSGVSIAPSPLKRLTSTRDAANDAIHCIIRTGDGSGTTKAAHTPAFLRSAKIPWLKNNSIQIKVVQAFTEMGLSPSRLVMPTKENVAQLEALIDAVTAMVETKRHLDKVEYDISVAKKQLESRAEGSSSEIGIKTEADAMDVDEAGGTETDGNEGRGISVMSARSGNGRIKKKNNRSMSISSVETTATNISTRANTKRQKRN